MASTTRRIFLKTSFAAAALCAAPGEALEAPTWLSNRDEQNVGSPDAAAMRKLASEMTGDVITKMSPEYESARLVFNRAFDQHPAVIARCADASDIPRVLDFAQTHNLPLAVRGGGHSRAGFGVCEGGVVLDLSGMRRVDVNAEKRVARVQAGALVQNVEEATGKFGLATPSGGCPNVGIAGFTLGGGEGKLMSMYGAACDNIVSAQVVLLDGKQVQASAESNPDLFWAIRGGGGNFGVVTEFEYRLHPVGKVLNGALTYGPGQVGDVLQGFSKFCASVPDEMVPLGELLPADGGPRFVNHLIYFGDAGKGNDLLKPLRSPIKPESDSLKVMSYLESQMEGFRPPPFAHFQTNLFLPELHDAVIKAIETAIHDAPAQFRVLIVPFTGAITRVGVADTAFALRQPGFEVDMLGTWSDPAQKPAVVNWVRALRDSLKPFAKGVYVNQVSEASEELVRAAYGTNLDRLRTIKKKYDPNNVLHVNQNIRPM